MRTPKFIALLTAALLALSASDTRSQSLLPAWQPPVPRRNKTIFAPRTSAGQNIFKGEKEVWLSDALEEVEGGFFDQLPDKVVSDYVARVGANLALYSSKPTTTFTFVVVNDQQPDAFTSGSGRIYVTVGMLRLMESEDELAGILAHEITHDCFSHIPKTITRQLFWMNGTKSVVSPTQLRNELERLNDSYQSNRFALVGEKLLGFSRYDELEADRGAFYIAYKTGYDPLALAAALEHYEAVQKKELNQLEYHWAQLCGLVLGNHPPTAIRSMALEWESSFVTLPVPTNHVNSPAFVEMKHRLELLEK